MAFTILEEPDGSAPVASAPTALQTGGGGRFTILEEPSASSGSSSGSAAAPARLPGYVEDIIRALPSGLARGAAGLAGLPGDVARLGRWAVNGATDLAAGYVDPFAEKVFGMKPGEMAARRQDAPKPPNAFDYLDSSAAIRGIEKITGPLYKPQTLPGQFAGTIAEFAPGAALTPGGLIAKGAQAVVPGTMSEAAGQLTKGTAAEPFARVGAGLVGAIGTSVVQARGATTPLMQEALKEYSADDVQRAINLMESSKAQPQPIDLTFGEALNQVTGGRAQRISQIERVVANSDTGGQALNDIYAARPGQVRAAGEAQLQNLAPHPFPADVAAIRNQEAARAAVAQTPEGQALAESLSLNAPRTTAEDAGRIIQPQLADVYARREGMRAALGEVEYEAARRSSTDVPVGERMIEVSRRADVPAPPPPSPAAEAPARVPRPSGPKPVDLSTYIARNGGIALDVEARAAGLDKIVIPGAGRLARPGGKSIDSHWREDLIEQGFLRPDPDGYASRNIRDELFDLLGRERQGQKTYRAADADAVAARNVGAVEAENTRLFENARSDVVLEHVASGGRPQDLKPDLVDEAANMLARGDEWDPLTAYERAATRSVQAAEHPRTIPTEVTERIPAAVYGQVNANPVLNHIDTALETAKGPVRNGLMAARRALMRPSGELDASVEGLHNSRLALADMVDEAKRFGNKTRAWEMNRALEKLDEALGQVPEYARAKAGYEAASVPLRPFEGVAGRAVERDQYGRGFTMPAERVAEEILNGGPSAVRDFLSVASRDAQLALENRLATRLVDAATDARGNLDADTLARGLRDQEDIVRQLPGLQARLDGIAASRRNMAPVENAPLGRIASTDAGQTSSARQGAMLLGEGQGDRYANVVLRDVKRLVKENPRAAETMLRDYVGDQFNRAIADLKSGPDVYGGAGFASALIGEPGKANNLTKAISALPDGEQRLKGFRRFIETLQATGYKPAKGSDTAFNLAIRDQLGRGGPVAAAIEAAGGGAVGAVIGGGSGGLAGAALNTRRALSDALTRYQAGRDTRHLAAMLTSPQGAKILKEIASAQPAKVPVLALRLVYVGKSAAGREAE